MDHQEPTQAASQPRKWVALCCLLALGFFALTCVLPVALYIRRESGPDPKETLARVPLGSKLADLDLYAAKGYDPVSDVIVYKQVDLATDTEHKLTNEYGTFSWKVICLYEEWTATATERNRFTGAINLYYISVVTQSFQICYLYLDGVLKKKDLIILS